MQELVAQNQDSIYGIDKEVASIPTKLAIFHHPCLLSVPSNPKLEEYFDFDLTSCVLALSNHTKLIHCSNESPL